MPPNADSEALIAALVKYWDEEVIPWAERFGKAMTAWWKSIDWPSPNGRSEP